MLLAASSLAAPLVVLLHYWRVDRPRSPGSSPSNPRKNFPVKESSISGLLTKTMPPRTLSVGRGDPDQARAEAACANK
jgi:hypothetical protein